MNFLRTGLLSGIFAWVLCACGVKGPPLPPIGSTPQKADAFNQESQAALEEARKQGASDASGASGQAMTPEEEETEMPDGYWMMDNPVPVKKKKTKESTQ